ncbi:hypothetical protein NDU88_002319, partial [Pleurodeles waltl]
ISCGARISRTEYREATYEMAGRRRGHSSGCLYSQNPFRGQGPWSGQPQDQTRFANFYLTRGWRFRNRGNIGVSTPAY